MSLTPSLWQSPVTSPTQTDGGQLDGKVIGLDDGTFLTLWTSGASAYNSTSITGVVYDYDGQLLSDETELDAFADGSQAIPEVTALSGGRFAAVYMDTTAPDHTIELSIFDTAGVATDVEIVFDPTANNPDIIGYTNGSMIVAYERSNGGDLGIFARAVAADGTVGSEFAIADTLGSDQHDVQLARLSNGDFVATYQHTSAATGEDVLYAVLGSNGTPVTSGVVSNTAAAETEQQVAALAGGGFVTVFTQDGGDGDGKGIEFQIRANDGSLATGTQTAATTTAGDQTGAAVTALADGGFFIAWRDQGSDVLRGQRFDAAGAKMGDEIILNSVDGTDLSLSTTSDDRILLSYTDLGASPDVHTAIFDPRGDVITGSALADSIAARVEGGTVEADAGDDRVLGGMNSDTVHGGAGSDTVWGGDGSDKIDGGDDADLLWGQAGLDTLAGGLGNDTVSGGSGRDIMSGGFGNDRFDFDFKTDSARGAAHDLITDFQNNHDKLDLSGIDAKTGLGGNQAFKFIGTHTFTHHQGELRFVVTDLAGTAHDKTMVEADVNGDGKADLQIELTGVHVMHSGDLAL